jgi:hypothetical protein
MRSWLNATVFETKFDAWCRGCNNDIPEGATVGFIPGRKGVHCLYCVVDVHLDVTLDSDKDEHEQQ